ncbi:MAG TPA: phosphoribosylformylglycinamidine synthase subunit PurL, partial [Chitinophagaceae bacterium]|nr:phosphoribosylformylglycinamidine synthase subunit PurL [Chitinophagaceae bacterium]
MQEATLEQALQLGLTESEFEAIKGVLGRTPNFTETAMYSVMWSEHCSYKNSIQWLKTLPKDGSRVLAKAGEENAGLIDIGDGWACSFKIESHNHPSAIEPFQGAATGVGGIHRDIFTMGARPVATLNSLRFGNLNDPKTKHLLKGVVKGISHYGNCFGVPTIGGEIYFEDCYQTNPLVNAMSVGVMKTGKTISATSYGAGNPVFIVGSDTGKDGIGGASFASADITEESAKDLPAVQVGDPFQEKKLLEACMELVETDAVIGMQDMGAAGITCSTSEMSAKGKHGMNIFLDKVPTRQKNMKAWEMLLSESQERMLVVVRKGHEEEVIRLFEKWDIHCVQIGEVCEGPFLRFYMHDELVAEVPAESLVLGGGAPVYTREYHEPAYFTLRNAFNPEQIPVPASLKDTAKKIISLPNIASKRWVYQQYDSMVGTGSINTNAPCDAAVVWVKETKKGIASTVDCNSRYVHADPYTGGMIAVCEAARNIVCSGATPAAITNCLNFGNPYNPEVYYQFVYALKGMSAACLKLDTPVTGGNVSFYNQSPDGPVYPTPTIGMVGILDDVSQCMTMDFKQAGDLIYLVGKSVSDLGSSEYIHKLAGVELSPAPYFNLDEEVACIQTILKLISGQCVQSVHDVAEGGLFTALVESARQRSLGFSIQTHSSIRTDAFLFGEAQGRFVVSVKPEHKQTFESFIGNHPMEWLGTVHDHSILVDHENWGRMDEWNSLYESTIQQAMQSA